MDRLPIEITLQIFLYLDKITDIVALLKCDRRLNTIGSDPKIWLKHLKDHWQFANASISDLYGGNSPIELDSSTAREKFCKRKRRDITLKKCILSIVETPQGRLKYVDAISDSFLDAADAVRQLRFQHGRSKKNYAIDYYCNKVEQHISRKLGIHILQKLTRSPEGFGDGMTPFFALYGITCFRQHNGLDFSPRNIIKELREAVYALHDQSQWQSIPLYDTENTGSSKIGTIMQALLESGIRPAAAEDYYDLRNSFLYCSIMDKRPTIPITLVATFVAVCCALDLDCFPIGFPGQVLAAINTDAETIYVAPYEGGKVYQRFELIARLQSYGMHDVDVYLQPCNVQELCVRSARNILNCIERGSDSDTLEGLYAALVTLKMAGRQIPLSEEQFMTLISLHFPYDISIWDKLQDPEHQELIRRARLEDVTVRLPKRRAEQPVPIRHSVGTIFRHALFDYAAV